MPTIYGRFSIGCWIDPDSEDDADAEDDFDDRDKMMAEARRLLQGGRFKSIVLYEWDAERDDYVELEELTLDSL